MFCQIQYRVNRYHLGTLLAYCSFQVLPDPLFWTAVEFELIWVNLEKYLIWSSILLYEIKHFQLMVLIILLYWLVFRCNLNYVYFYLFFYFANLIREHRSQEHWLFGVMVDLNSLCFNSAINSGITGNKNWLYIGICHFNRISVFLKTHINIINT